MNRLDKKEFIEEIHNAYPGLSIEEYSDIISNKFGIKKTTANRYYYKYSNCSASDRTLNKIIEAYEYFVENGQKPTQKAIAQKLNISLITIKRYWKSVKKR
jgi:hypothetical protein